MKEIVEQIICEWRLRLGLGLWDFVVTEATAPCPDDRPGELQTRMDTLVSSPYLGAQITVYPAFAKLTPESQRDVVLHELVHCLLAEIDDQVEALRSGQLVTARDQEIANEHTTETLTRLFLAAWGHRNTLGGK